jgi:hypothetical protein
VPRAQFCGLAAENGRSILWFKRKATVDGFAEDTDYFEGIAGAIAHTAPALGFTNQWLLDVDLKPGNDGEGNRWNPSVFADLYPYFNRAFFYAPEVANDAPLLWHVGYGWADSGDYGGVIVPEAPSGWNYVHLGTPWHGRYHLNELPCIEDPDCEEQRRRFYKSCPVYKRPLEIEAADAYTEGGVEYVRITLSGRLQNTCGEDAGAPQTFSRDTDTWDGATIAAEPYRTDENGLRLYLLKLAKSYETTAITGDCALNALPPDEPGPCIYPHFFLTQLMPEPYDGGEAVPKEVKTPLWHDTMALAEVYLRALCEGFVDSASTVELAQCSNEGGVCQAGEGQGLFDFTFENLCYRAFGGRWIGALPTEATSRLGDWELRDDGPQGFGPLPYTRAAGEIFNQLAACVNLLTRARLELPLTIEARQAYAEATVDVTPDFAVPNTGAYWVGQADMPLPSEWSDWADGLGNAWALASSGVCPSGEGSCGAVGGDWGLYGANHRAEWRIKPDQDITLALPADWRAQATAIYGLLLCQCTWVNVPDPATSEEPWRCGGDCDTGQTWNSLGGPPIYADEAEGTCQVVPFNTTETVSAVFATAGILIPPVLPDSMHVWFTANGATCTSGPDSGVYLIQGNTNITFGFIDVPTVPQ